MQISDAILGNAKKARAKVAIGLIKTNQEIIASLHRAYEYADIVVVGNRIEGFESLSADDDSSRILVRLLHDHKVDAIVRGNLDSFYTMESFAKEFGYKKILRTACIKDLKGREFLLVPAAKKEGNTFNERRWMAAESAKFLNTLGIQPKVGVLALSETRGFSDTVDQSLDEADYIVSKLKDEKIDATFAGYAPEVAVNDHNIIVPPNGMIGNFIWRCITGFGGGIDIGDVALIPEVFVDGSKYWDDYYQPIVFATSLVNMRKKL